jgi:hypothetical protein
VSGKGGRKEPRREALNGEDHALWGEVTKSIAPLRARPEPAQSTDIIDEIARAARKTPPPRASAPPPKLAPRAPALATIDRRTKQRLSRGTTETTRASIAWHDPGRGPTKLESFLRSAGARPRPVLAITGSRLVS